MRAAAILVSTSTQRAAQFGPASAISVRRGELSRQSPRWPFGQLHFHMLLFEIALRHDRLAIAFARGLPTTEIEQRRSDNWRGKNKHHQQEFQAAVREARGRSVES